MKFNLGAKLREYGRVLKVTRKPTAEEFKLISKVTALGILLIGAIGFIVFMISRVFV